MTAGLKWQEELTKETKAQIKKYMQEHPDKREPGEMETSAEVFCHWYGSALCKNWVKLPGELDHSNTEGRDKRQTNLLTFGDGLEVKAIRNYITRNNDGNARGGSLTFELFNSAEPGAYTGWMLSLFDPETFNEIKKEHGREERAVIPDNMTFVLERAGDTPFATIVFEDVQELRERLYNLCPDPDGWGLNNLRKQKPYTDLYWKRFKTWNDRWGVVVKNNWQVPFAKLKDIVTVTMITPDIDVAEELEQAEYKCSEEVATARLNNLKYFANETGCGTFDPAIFERPTNQHLEPFKIRIAEKGEYLEYKENGEWRATEGRRLEELKDKLKNGKQTD